MLLISECTAKYRIRNAIRLLDFVTSPIFQTKKKHFKTQVTVLFNLLRYRSTADLKKLHKFHTQASYKRIDMFRKEILRFLVSQNSIKLLPSHNPTVGVKRLTSNLYTSFALSANSTDVDYLEPDEYDADSYSEDYKPCRQSIDIEYTYVSIDAAVGVSITDVCTSLVDSLNIVDLKIYYV